jgi:hypothetical protein
MPKKFEYMKFNLSEHGRQEDDIDNLNYYGDQGWQVVVIQINGMAYLMRAMEEPASAIAAKPTASQPRDTTLDAAFHNRKTDETLLRELHIMRKLATQEITKLSEIVEVIQSFEPTYEYASVVALLDRLENVGVVERPQKGKYKAGPTAQLHLLGLIQELTARKITIPNGAHKK